MPTSAKRGAGSHSADRPRAQRYHDVCWHCCASVRSGSLGYRFVGFIFDTPEGVKQCIGDDATDEQIEKALRDEVAVYASYLEGDITWYSVEDDETNFYEACGGYVGDHKQCESECFAALEQAIIKRLSEGDERAEWNARGTQTK